MRKTSKEQAQDIWVKKWFQWGTLHTFLTDFHPGIDNHGRKTMVCEELGIYYNE